MSSKHSVKSIGLDEVVEHFTLTEDEQASARIRSGPNRLGFAVLLKFVLWKGRFPGDTNEVPKDAVRYLAQQVDASSADLRSYNLGGRTAKRHRSEIRSLTGFRACGVDDAKKVAADMAEQVMHRGRDVEVIRNQVLALCRSTLLEPPSDDRISEIARSVLHQAEQKLFEEIHSRIGKDAKENLMALTRDDHLGTLALIRSAPGNVSLDSMLTEISKLEAIRKVGLPPGLFDEVGSQVIEDWSRQVMVESPSHLKRRGLPVAAALLAALLHRREKEVTDALVQLLISTIHRINARAEKKVVQEFVKDFKRIRGKETLLRKIAEASLKDPDRTVREVIFPIVGGESTFENLVNEYKMSGSEYEKSKRLVFKSSYTNHYRRGLIRLLEVLEFRSNNSAHKPIIEALGLIARHIASNTRYFPVGEVVVREGAIDSSWSELLTAVDSQGRGRVIRSVYEACVFQTLRDRLRSKEIWVVGAHEWRNPDEDLPTDFEVRRPEYYEELSKPLDATAFVSEIRDEMRHELRLLDSQVNELAWVEISDRKNGAIRLTPLEAQVEPQNLRRLKEVVRARWGQVALIDVVAEAALQTNMLDHLTAVGSREALAKSVLWERLLLLAYAYGTNTGISAVAASKHGHSEADLRYAARRYFTIDGARAVAVQLANATFAARQESIWGSSTTTVASDSTHFRAYDQNLFTEWHSRYGGRGVLIYWHVEKQSMAVHSQLISCAASEVAAMIEGAVRHGTTMELEGNYVDSHGQSEIGFGITRLLGFDLLPRIKQIKRVKLYRPDREASDAHPNLRPAMTRGIRWDLIEQNYDQMIKYATAIRLGTASTEAILRRFTRNASHPVYQAMLELGRAQKTIFVARYLRDRELQREINEGLNLIESWNRVNSVIFFGKSGEFASNRRDQQQLGMLALHILQAALVFVNTLMVQTVLAEPEWQGVLTDEDKRGLTALFWSHIRPYGEIKLDLNKRLDLDGFSAPLV